MCADSSAPGRECQRAGAAAYLITFSCYGSHLHGEEGRVDREHNTPATPALAADAALLELSKSAMRDAPCELDLPRRYFGEFSRLAAVETGV